MNSVVSVTTETERLETEIPEKSRYARDLRGNVSTMREASSTQAQEGRLYITQVGSALLTADHCDPLELSSVAQKIARVRDRIGAAIERIMSSRRMAEQMEQQAERLESEVQQETGQLAGLNNRLV